MNGRFFIKSTLAALTIAAACTAGGCSHTSGMAGPVFFPPAPNPPRVQYLGKISDSQDILGKKSSFSLLVLTGSAEEQGNHVISKPYGIIEEGGKLYVTDIGSAKVWIIDPIRKAFDPLKGNAGVGKLKRPVNVAVDKEGTIFVADSDRREVLVYDPSGNYRYALGKDIGMKPVDLLVDQDNVYILDYMNAGIHVLEKATGQHLRTIGQGKDENTGLSLPTGMAMDSKGFIYVTNSGSGKVIKLDRDGHIVMSFGKFGDGFGQFGRPKGIAVDEEGRIYVVDSNHNNVQIFNDKGRLLMFFGDPGLPKGSLNIPAAVIVSRGVLPAFQQLADPDFRLEQVILVTNQFGNDKIGVYGLGESTKPIARPLPPKKAPPKENAAAKEKAVTKENAATKDNAAPQQPPTQLPARDNGKV